MMIILFIIRVLIKVYNKFSSTCLFNLRVCLARVVPEELDLPQS